MRSRFLVLFILLFIGILSIIALNYFISNRNEDKFLLHLPPPAAETDFDASSGIFLNNSLNSDNLLNLKYFNYTLANDVCQKTPKDLLGILIITSYVGHDELRAAHRVAISQNKLSEMGFKRVFLLAGIPSKEHFITQHQVNDEQRRFGDLLQGNFIESYRNLSYKHVMGLRWAATNCANAKFIVKLDDDIIYDIFQLRRYLETIEVQQQPKLIANTSFLAGYILDTKAPIRNRANKWYVSEKEYTRDKYPAYLSGWMYLTNAATALRLVHAAQQARTIFWIDDTWITGILRERLNIPMERLNSWFSANSDFLDCCLRDLKQFNYECEYFVGPNGGDSKLIIEFLHNIEKCYFDECDKRPPEKSLKRTCVGSVKKIIPDHGVASIQQIKLRR